MKKTVCDLDRGGVKFEFWTYFPEKLECEVFQKVPDKFFRGERGSENDRNPVGMIIR